MYTRDVGRSSRFDYGKTIYAVLWSLKECYCFEPFWILYCFPLDVIGKISFRGRGRNISTYTSTFGWTVCLCGWRSIIGSFMVSLHIIRWIVVLPGLDIHVEKLGACVQCVLDFLLLWVVLNLVHKIPVFIHTNKCCVRHLYHDHVTRRRFAYIERTMIYWNVNYYTDGILCTWYL